MTKKTVSMSIKKSIIVPDVEISAEQEKMVKTMFKHNLKQHINSMLEIAIMKPLYTSDEFHEKYCKPIKFGDSFVDLEGC